MIRRCFVAAAVLFLIAGTVDAGQRVNMKPGKWEISSQVKMDAMPPGMPAGMQIPAMTHTQCIQADELIPEDPAAQEQNADCQQQDFQIKGDTVTWKMVCQSDDGPVTVNGRITYKGETFEGEVKTRTPGPDGMDLTTVMKGKRVGECD